MLRAVTFALLTSLLYVLCFPRFDCASLAWIAFLPLIFSVLNASPRHAFKLGWLAGTSVTTGLMTWLIPVFQAAHTSMLLAIFCWILLSLYLGLFWGLWTSAIVRLKPHVGAQWFPFWAAALWVALEFLKGWLFSGFPWALTGYSQWHHLALIQISRFTGVYGVSFLILLTNLTFATIFLNGKPTTSRPLAATLMIWIAVLGWGGYRLHHTNDARFPSLRVALLQGNIDQYLKWDQRYVDDIKRTYQRLALSAAADHPDLIVWPETAVPGYVMQDPSLIAWLTSLIQETGTAHLVGAPHSSGNLIYNVAIAIDAQGRPTGIYGKQHLVPFGEVVPFAALLGRWISVLNQLGGTAASRDSRPLAISGAHIAVNICYEAIFPELVRQSVHQGADLIANITNDGWYLRTAAPYQHFIHNVFRAVENDRWLVRADNTGISAIIDPTGHIERQSGIFEAAVVEGTVHLRTTQTPYSRFGDVFAWACLLLAALPLLIRRDTF